MRSTKTRAGLAVGMAAALGLAACGGDSSDNPSEPDESGEVEAAAGGTLRYGATFEPTNWTMAAHPNEAYVSLVYDGLFQHAADGVTVEPVLASDWELTNEGATFELREGVTFHDGTPFDAEAVVTNLEHIRDQGNQWSVPLNNVTEMTAVDEHTVELTFSAPSPTLLSSLAARGFNMISPAALEDGSYELHPVGTGPYVLDEDASTTGSILVFTEFEDYHSPEDLGPDRIEMHFVADSNAAYNALSAGQVDVAFVDQSTVDSVESQGFSTETYTALAWHLMMHDREGLFAEENVRRAMCHAMPLQSINDVQYEGRASIASQRFDDGDPAYVPDLEPYEYDLELAQSYMDEAGNPEISFQMPHGTGTSAVHELIRESWNSIGIDVEIIPMENSQYFGVLFNADYPVIFNVSNGEDPGMAAYYTMRFTEGGGGNPFNAAPPAGLAEIFDAAMEADSPEDQEPYWQEMTQFIHDNAYDCGFFDVPHTVAYDPDVVDTMAVTPYYPSALRYRDIRVSP